jgi:hypothetical protein
MNFENLKIMMTNSKNQPTWTLLVLNLKYLTIFSTFLTLFYAYKVMETFFKMISIILKAYLLTFCI